MGPKKQTNLSVTLIFFLFEAERERQRLTDLVLLFPRRWQYTLSLARTHER
jgi:hypothetical protein